MELEDQGPEIHGELTDDLEGRVFEYTYMSGDRYRLSFADHHIVYDILDTGHGAAASPSVGPDGRPISGRPRREYRARKLREQLYLVHWLVPRVVHVALVIDLDGNTINVAAMMPPNQWEFFDTAMIDVAH